MLPVILRTDAELEMGSGWPADTVKSFKLLTAPDDRPETLIALAPQADIIFTCYAPITADVIAAAPSLRGIVKYGVGVDSIDLVAATASGVPVVHCPDYGTETVADHAFALLISVARRITGIHEGLRSKGWLWPELPFQGVELSGKTMGLVGYGRIGKAMAQRTAGFRMRQLVYDPYVPQDYDGPGDLQFTSLDHVLQEADFLSLHCVLTPETQRILGAEQLDQMKESAILVNVSRGALVDEGALIEALRAGKIAGAGLDVFPIEPLERNHPYFDLDNVLLTPHFAFYTKEAHTRLEVECLQAVQMLLDGNIPPNIKNRELLNGDSRNPHETVGRDGKAKLPPHAIGADHWKVVEGDVNRSPERQHWRSEQIDAETEDLLERDEQAFIHQSLSTPCLDSLTACDGAYLVDAQGRRFMDFHGNSVHQVGYRHPKVIQAIKDQLDTLPFCPRRFTNSPAVELAQRLADLAPDGLNRILFAPGGSMAVGMALKLARLATGRHKTISMWGSFHGASLDAISIGGEALFRDGMGPLLPGAFHVPWPTAEDEVGMIERIMVEQGDIGAVVAEPMRATTVRRPPHEYWRRVRQLCDRHGALLIFDEIPMAFGRTGRMFCCEHSGVIPDVLVVGKGLGGGVMPMAATIARDDLNIGQDRALGHYTHEKSPVGAAAGLATLDVIEDEGLLDQSVQLGRFAVERLTEMQQRHSLITEIRGLGLAMAVELANVNKEPALDEAQQVLYHCLADGLNFKVSDGNVLTLTPPLTITRAELETALLIVDRAIAAVSRGERFAKKPAAPFA